MFCRKNTALYRLTDGCRYSAVAVRSAYTIVSDIWILVIYMIKTYKNLNKNMQINK